MLVALRQLARALCSVVHVPYTPPTYGDTAVEREPFLAGTFVDGEQGQQPQGERGAWAGDRETGHLEEIASASYVEVAKTLGEGRGA